MELFSPAQCLGYLSFVVGVAAFLQKRDLNFKRLNAAQSLVYAIHFVMLGNLPASASSLISCVRSLLALKPRSPMVPVVIIVVYVAAGAAFARTGAGWIPIIASCAGTLAIFKIQGIPLRMVLLGCTFMWLVNNIISGSIGGVLLETAISIANIVTITRMFRALPQEPTAPAAGALTTGD